MRYSFIAAENHFQRCSTLYYVYDNFLNKYVATVVIGYDMLNKKYFFTEFKGSSEYTDIVTEGILSSFQLCAILADLYDVFGLMDYLDIVSDKSIYNQYGRFMPKITIENLMIYDSYAEVAVVDSEYILDVSDIFLNKLVYDDIIEGQFFLLEELTDDLDDPFVDLVNDPFICKKDDFQGMFLFIKDWDKIKENADAFNKTIYNID